MSLPRPSRSTAVQQEAEKWFDAGFGWRDVERELHRIGSQTDPITGLPICYSDEETAAQLASAMAQAAGASP